MEFLSSLKTAYDSIGSEITKTFDSSDFEKDQSKSSDKTKSEELSEDKDTQPQQQPEQTTPSQSDEKSIYATPSAVNDDWGGWEEQPRKTTPTTVTPTEAIQSPPAEKVQEPVATSTPASRKPKSSLENLSRDDLIKYIKKQAALVQKLKSKEAPPSEGGGVMEELSIVRSERDQAVGELHKLKQSLNQLTKDNQDLTDQVQALTDANSKLKEFCLEAQSQQDQLPQLEAQVASLTAERDEMKSQLTKQQTALSNSEGTAAALKLEIEKLQVSKEEAREKVEMLTQQLSTSQNDSSGQVQELTQQLESLQEELSVAVKETKMAAEEAENALRAKDNELQLSIEERTKLNSLCQELRAQNGALNEQLAASQSANEPTASPKTGDKSPHPKPEEVKKLKAFVVKLKKELKEKETAEETMRTELSSLRVATETTEKENQMLKSQLEEITDQQNTHSQDLQAKLTASEDSVAKASSTVEQLERERDGLANTVRGLEERLELSSAELSSTQSDLATANTLVNTHLGSITKLENELSAVKSSLEQEVSAHKATLERLSAAEKDVKSSELMDLELSDYQRSIRALEEQVAGRGEELQTARRESQAHLSKIQELNKKLESSGVQRQAEAETVTKLKALLVRNKKELADTRGKEAELREQVDELKSQLEQEKGLAEEAKVQLSELSANIQSQTTQHDTEVETLQTTVRALELKQAGLRSELSASQANLTMVQSEYDSYKVRVHSVLKQKSSAVGQVEISPEIKKTYEDEIATLKSELQETKSQLSGVLSDHEELMTAHDSLTSRHDQLLQEATTTREKLQVKLREKEAIHEREGREQRDLIGQLRSEVDHVTSAFKSQISGLQQEHKKVVLSLREELHSAHSQLSRLQEEADNKVLERAAGTSQPKPPPTEPRTSGVGMENTDSESTPPITPVNRGGSAPSLERLLSSQSDNSLVVPSDDGLREQLAASGKRIAHLTELLRESEASSVRLSEQAKLLKEEIRRLERNQEREGVSNMEYLKNVILKFLANRDVSERNRLVPVITKLLQLSPQEVKYIQDIIQGDTEGEPPGPLAQGVGGAKSTLSNYIHRWTGY